MILLSHGPCATQPLRAKRCIFYSCAPAFCCRFVNDVLHRRESGMDLSGRAPVEGSHGEMIVGTLSNSQLVFEVLKGKEPMGSVELLIVFSMTTLYFAVVPGRIGFDQPMPDPQPFQFCFKSSRRIAALWQQSLGKLRTVIGLYTLDHIGGSLHNVLQKQHRGIGAVLFEGFQIAEPAVFVDEGVLILLIPLCSRLLTNHT